MNCQLAGDGGKGIADVFDFSGNIAGQRLLDFADQRDQFVVMLAEFISTGHSWILPQVTL
jgi:hypothetical protein